MENCPRCHSPVTTGTGMVTGTRYYICKNWLCGWRRPVIEGTVADADWSDDD